jgi:hypothetical protein
MATSHSEITSQQLYVLRGMKRSSPRIHLYFIPSRYVASIGNHAREKGRGGTHGKYYHCFNGVFSLRHGGTRTSHYRGDALGGKNSP